MSETFQERMSRMIKGELARSGGNQTKLADRIGVSKGTITNWKNGSVREIYPPNLVAAARECGKNVIWLVTGEGPELPSRYAADGVDLSLLEETVTTVLSVLDERHINLPWGKVGKLVATAYEDAAEEAAPPRRAKVLRLVNLSR